MRFECISVIFNLKHRLVNSKKPQCPYCYGPIEISANAYICSYEKCKGFFRKETVEQILCKHDRLIAMLGEISPRSNSEISGDIEILQTHNEASRVIFVDSYNKCPICRNVLISVEGKYACTHSEDLCENIIEVSYKIELINEIISIIIELEALVISLEAQTRCIGKEYPPQQRQKFM